MSVPRIAAIGLTSWDRFVVVDTYPSAGSYEIVRETLEQSGGTTANMAHALARLGMQVTLCSKVGADAEGQELRRVLESLGCDCRYVESISDGRSDSAIIVVSGSGDYVDRTIYWNQGARLKHGDAVPLNDLFEHDLVILDVDDARLRRFIVDLPMHVSPRTKLLGTLTYLVEIPPDDGIEMAIRHDYLTGNHKELCYLTQTGDPIVAIEALQSRMDYADTRLAAISLGSDGCAVVTETTVEMIPAFDVDVVDTTGAGDAFASGVALGILEQRSLHDIGLLGNAMGALSIQSLGARSSLPSRSELSEFLAAHSIELNSSK